MCSDSRTVAALFPFMTHKAEHIRADRSGIGMAVLGAMQPRILLSGAFRAGDPHAIGHGTGAHMDKD